MRRKEFKIEQEEEVAQFLQEMSFGFLGTSDEQGQPRVTPLNFVYMEGCFYFHGSHAGGKMESIRQQARVCFTVADEYALIPSYFSDPHLACPATAYFKKRNCLWSGRTCGGVRREGCCIVPVYEQAAARGRL